jgi:hypothetical protein
VQTVRIRPTQPQADFHALTCKYPAFVGGFGTGKSETMANQAFMDASHSPDALIALYEPTYDLIRLIMAPRMEEKLQQYGIRYKYNKSENIIYSSSSQFGDFILRTLDNPARIVGYESYRSHVDEIDTLKEDHAREAWNKIVARNRQKPAGIEEPFNRVSAYTTPEGFRFVYDRWVKNSSEAYMMVQASTLSNPFLPDDYVDSLRTTYPSNLIEAYINGQFVNLVGGTIYNQYTAANRSFETIEDSDKILYVGMDFNVTKMAARVFVYRDRKPHCVDEFNELYDTSDMIENIKMRYPDKRITVYPDASGKNRKTNAADETDISLLKAAGFRVLANDANPRVKTRINSVNAMFCNAKGEHNCFVNRDTCPVTHEELEQQVYNDKGEPDKQGGKDHGNDAFGYFIDYEHGINKQIDRLF